MQLDTKAQIGPRISRRHFTSHCVIKLPQAEDFKTMLSAEKLPIHNMSYSLDQVNKLKLSLKLLLYEFEKLSEIINFK